MLSCLVQWSRPRKSPYDVRRQAALLLGLLSACNSDGGTKTRAETSPSGTSDRSAGRTAPAPSAATEERLASARSLVQLLATPERYKGAGVVVGGFLVLEKGQEFTDADGQIYLSRDDYLFGTFNHVNVKFGECASNPRLVPSSMHVNDAAQYSNGYAIVRGWFDPPARDAPTPFGGTICNIGSVTPLAGRREAGIVVRKP